MSMTTFARTYARTMQRTDDPDHAAEVARTEQQIERYLEMLNRRGMRAACEGRTVEHVTQAARAVCGHSTNGGDQWD